MNKFVLLGIAAVFASSIAVPSEAQEETVPNEAAAADVQSRSLEEIIVTAEKRRESIQDLPIAVSAFSGETLRNRAIDDVQGLQQIAPSVQVDGILNTFANVAIRGISTAFGNISGNPSAAVSQDGMVYSLMEMANLDFFDVDRVEVLRGPQGTLGGRNATAGAINVHSKRPTEEFEGGFKATIGNYHRLAIDGYLSGPIVGDRLLGRLAVRSDRDEGWLEVTNLGKRLGDRDKLQARASLLAHLTDNFDAHLILEGMRDQSTTTIVNTGRIRRDTPTALELDGFPIFDWDQRTIEADQPGDANVEKVQTTLGLSWDLGSAVRLTATTGYVDVDWRSAHDLDGTSRPGLVWWSPPEAMGLFLDAWQVSQEVNLTADLTNRLDVIVGGLYFQRDAQFGSLFGLGSLPPGSFESVNQEKLTSWAGYTQWRYRLTDDIRLTAGVRYTHDSKDADSSRLVLLGTPLVTAPEEASWSEWTPRFSVEYMPSDDLTLYASVSRGFKSGGWSLPGGDKYEPEFVWNHEVGVKGNWFKNRLRTALTGFYMDYTDMQQQVLAVRDGFPVAEVVNAPGATIAGVELEADAMIIDRFRIAFAGSWLDATYDELRSHDPVFPELGEPGPAGLSVRDLAGNQMIRAPKWQFNIYGEYRAPLPAPMLGGNLQGVLRASYSWQDHIFFTIFNHDLVSEDAYGVLNLGAAVESRDGAWQLSAYVNNVTDKFYRVGQLSGQTPDSASQVNPGRPRTYGVSLAYRF